MKIGIPMLVKGLSMIASHVGDVSRQPTKILSNVAPISTVVGAGLGSAAYIGGDELHSLIGAWDGASTDQMVAHVAVYVAQAVMGVVSVWAMAKKPGTKIGD